MGIFLSYHILAKDGSVVQFSNPYTAIPFVHIPDVAHYMSIVVPAEWRRKCGAFVDIEMVQEGVGWWGSPLRASLV
jgi:hypothetical protein